MWNFLLAYGDKLLTFLTGICTLLATPQMSKSLGLSEPTMAWVAFSGAVLALAHATFVNSNTQQQAVATLKGQPPVIKSVWMLLIATPLLALLGGCAALTGANQIATQAVQIGIQEATARVIQANCPTPSEPLPASCYANRAAKFASILTDFNAAANNPSANMAAVQAALQKDVGGLSPQEQIIVQPLVGDVLQYLQAQTGTGVFGAVQLSIVNQVNGWMTYVCNLYLPPASQLHFK